MNEPWVTCPECGVGRGADHKRDCSHRKRPRVPNYHTRPVLQQIGSDIQPDSTPKEVLPVIHDDGDQFG